MLRKNYAEPLRQGIPPTLHPQEFVQSKPGPCGVRASHHSRRLNAGSTAPPSLHAACPRFALHQHAQTAFSKWPQTILLRRTVFAHDGRKSRAGRNLPTVSRGREPDLCGRTDPALVREGRRGGSVTATPSTATPHHGLKQLVDIATSKRVGMVPTPPPPLRLPNIHQRRRWGWRMAKRAPEVAPHPTGKDSWISSRLKTLQFDSHR